MFSIALLILLFISIANAQKCLANYPGYASNCITCSLNYYPDPSKFSTLGVVRNVSSDDCISKLGGYKELVYYVSPSYSGGSRSDVFSTLAAALRAAYQPSNSKYNLSIYLTDEAHFITKSQLNESPEYFLRRLSVNISISALPCSKQSLAYCFPSIDESTKVRVFVKTDEFLIMVQGELRITNVNFLGYDLILNDSVACKNKYETCCSDDRLNKSIIVDPDCGLMGRPLTTNWRKDTNNAHLSFLNFEFPFDISATFQIPSIILISCSFQGFFGISEKSWPSIIKADQRLFFRLEIKLSLFSELLLEKGPFYIAAKMEDPFYTFFLRDENYSAVSSNFPLFKSSVNIADINFQKYNIRGSIVYDSGRIFYFEGTNQPVVSISNTQFSEILSENSTLFEFTSNFFGSIDKVAVKKSFLFALARISSASSAIITDGDLQFNYFSKALFLTGDRCTLTIDRVTLNMSDGKPTVNLYIEGIGSFFVNIKNSNIVNSNNIHFSFNMVAVLWQNVTISNITFSMDLFTAALCNSTFRNITLRDIKPFNSSYPAQNLFVVQRGYMVMDYNDVSNLVSGGGCFLFLDANHTINNSNFHDFTKLSWFYKVSNIFEIQFINSIFKNGNPTMFLSNERKNLLNYSYAIIRNTTFENIQATGDFFFKWISTYVYFLNSIWRNVTMAMTSRSFLKKEEGDVYIHNSIFDRCGFAKDTTTMRRIYDKSWITLWVGYRFDMTNTTYTANENHAQRSGFVNLYEMINYANISNTMFKVFRPNPASSYKGIIIYNSPVTILRNIYFENLVCTRAQPTIMHENGAGLLVIGSLDYSPVANTLKLEASGLIFINCSCSIGSSASFINIKEARVSDSSFQNGTGDKGGHFNAMSVDTLTLLNSQFTFSTTTLRGGILNFELVSKLNLSSLKFRGGNSKVAGCAYFESVSNCLLQNLTMEDMLANQDCGALYLYKTNINMTNTSFKNIKSEVGQGGVIYLAASSNFTCKGISSYISSANQAGFLFVKDSSFLIIKDTDIAKSTSVLNAAVMLLAKSNTLLLENISVNECESQKANGVIYIKEEENVLYNITGISCRANRAKMGSCIYYNSNAKIILNSIDVSDSFGSALYFFSFETPFIDLKKLSIKNSNKDAGSTEGIVQILNVNISIKNAELTNNQAEGYIIFSSRAYMDLENIKLVNSHSINQVMYSLHIENSFVDLGEILITCEKTGKIFNSAAIYSENSEITAYSIEISNAFTFESSIINMKNTEAEFYNSKLLNNKGQNSGGFQLDGTALTLVYCDFSGNIFDIESSTTESGRGSDLVVINSIYTYQHEVKIVHSNFIIAGKLSMEILYLEYLTITNCTFVSTSSPPINYITSLSKYSPSGLRIANVYTISLSNLIFVNLTADRGSGLLISNEWDDNVTELSIKNAVFQNCRALYGGAIFLSGLTNTSLRNVTFANNMAFSWPDSTMSGVAACIVQDCSSPECDLKFDSVEFRNNYAELYAPTLLSKQKVSITLGANFKNNSDLLNYSTKVSSYPITAVLLNSIASLDDVKNEVSLLSALESSLQTIDTSNNKIKIASGIKLNVTMALVDAQGQLLKFDSLSTANIVYKQSIENTNSDASKGKTTVENSYARCEKGVFFFQNLKINIMPNTVANFSVDISYFENTFGQSSSVQGQSEDSEKKMALNLSLLMEVRPCWRGELFKEDLSCMRCDPKTFSLEDPMSLNSSFQRCLPCFDGAECLGGNLVFPERGKWRHSSLSKLILDCYIKDACLGRNGLDAEDIKEFTEELARGLCHPSHEGNLCFYCKQGFAKISSKSLCESCAEKKVESYLKFSVILVLTFLYIGYYVKLYSNVMMSQNVERRVLLKILVNHLQQITLVSLIDLGWSIDIKAFFSLQNYLSFLTDDIFSSECLFSLIGGDMQFIKVTYNLMMPIILSFTFLVIWLVISYVRVKFLKTNLSTQSILDKLRLFLLISFYILYPQIISASFSLMNCKLLDESHNIKVLSNSPDLVCWEPLHTKYVLAASIPGFCFWGVAVPLLCGILMRRHAILIKSNIRKVQAMQSITGEEVFSPVHDTRKVQRDPSDIFAFLYKGYNEKHYYWEVVIFLKKLSLTFIAIFTELFPTHSKSVLLLIVLIFFIYLNLRCKPYISDFLNHFDTFSLIVSFITANVGILLWSKDLQPASPFFLFLIILANFGFFGSWIYYFGIKSFGQNFWKVIGRTCISKPWKIFSVIKNYRTLRIASKKSTKSLGEEN